MFQLERGATNIVERLLGGGPDSKIAMTMASARWAVWRTSAKRQPVAARRVLRQRGASHISVEPGRQPRLGGRCPFRLLDLRQRHLLGGSVLFADQDMQVVKGASMKRLLQMSVLTVALGLASLPAADGAGVGACR